MCKSGGFNLTNFFSNIKAFLENIPVYARKKILDKQELTNQALLTEAALGVLQDVEKDMFIFRLNLKKNLGTQKRMLSILSSIFDPLGFVSPLFLKGRMILQQLCEQNVKWDEPFDETGVKSQEYLKANTQKLCDIKIPRCLRKKGCMKIEHISLHYFSDESGTGYGVVVSIRSVRENSEIFCNTVTAKPRVAPLKFMSVPRFELTAAVLALKTAVQLREELDMEVHDKVFWTGSRVVLGYIQNTKKRFKTFVANCIYQIISHAGVLQWQCIATKENPADDCFRGLEMKQNKNLKKQCQGPEFLWGPQTAWCEERLQHDIAEDDVEMKITMRANAMSKEDDILTVLESRMYSWKKMKRVMAQISFKD